MSLLWLLAGPLFVHAQEIPQTVINQSCTACNPTDVHTADLDDDQDPDVLSASAGDNKIAWYENLDSGGFSEQKTITTSATDASSVFAADIDDDQDLDVLATHNSGDDEDIQVAWYENLDSGGFSSEIPLDTGGNQNATSVFATDIDGDDDPDVVVGFDSFNGDQVVWHENLDDGGLSSAKTVTGAGDGSQSVYAVNLDGDGDKDIISADDGDQIEWYENLDDGGFSSANVLISDYITPSSVHAADVDGDNDQDIIGASEVDGVLWFENLDGGGFSAANTISSSTDDVEDLYTADVDGDGDPDLASAASFGDDIAWYENLDSGGFSNKKIVSNDAKTALAVTAADVDDDGAADLLSASRLEDKIAWHKNQLDDSGGFSSGTPVNVIPNAIRPTAVRTADLDDDGDQDVLSASAGDEFTTGKIAWYENQDDGGFSDQNTISTQVPDARSVVAADLDGDDDQDILFGSLSAGIGWFENLDAGGFSSLNSIASNIASREVAAADLDGDGDKDALFVTGDKVQWLENLDDGGFADPFPNLIELTDDLFEARSVVATDIGSDGDQDVVAAGAGSSLNSGKLVWFENDGTFSSAITIDDNADDAQSVSITDFDGDGDKDILVGDNFDSSWYENLDDGGFSAKTQIAGTAKSVRTDDVNGDGSPDVLLAGGSRVAWIENLGSGDFGEPDTITTNVQDARSVFSANLDDDSDPDVLSVSFNDNKIAWYENTDGTLPVDLAGLSAQADGQAAVLTWTTASETTNAGFAVQHTSSEEDAWTEVGFVESTAAGGTTTETQSYQFTAEDLSVGTHQFRLKQVDVDGSTHLSKTVTVDLGMDEPVRLTAPAPHPVQNQATLSFAVKEAKETTIRLYNVLGQKVRTLYRGTPRAGEARTVDLSATGLSSGAYFLRLQAGERTKTQRVTIVR